MTNKTLELIKEIASNKTKKKEEPIPRKKRTGKAEVITINPTYTPYRKNANIFRQPNDTGKN